jgi:hypothetical protein
MSSPIRGYGSVGRSVAKRKLPKIELRLDGRNHFERVVDTAIISGPTYQIYCFSECSILR